MAFPTAQQIMAAAPKGGLQQLGELLQAGTQGYLQGQQIGQARDDRQAQQQAAQSQAQKEAQAADLFRRAVASDNPQEQEQLVAQASLLAPDLIDKALGARKSMQQSTKPMQKGEGALVFNPNTGEYTINETAKDYLTKKAEAKAREGKKLGVKDIKGINKDVTDLTKDAVGINNAARDLASLEQSSSPSAQLAAIFKFMKALDPTSVVREGEQEMARKTGGAADSLVGYVNQLKGRGSLTPEVFSDMVGTAKNLANSAVTTSASQVNSYLDVYGNTIEDDLKERIRGRIPKPVEQGGNSSKGSAPASAIEYLKQNPQVIDQFEAKYGYRPEGF